jgi:hypothetical protein
MVAQMYRTETIGTEKQTNKQKTSHPNANSGQQEKKTRTKEVLKCIQSYKIEATQRGQRFYYKIKATRRGQRLM